MMSLPISKPFTTPSALILPSAGVRLRVLKLNLPLPPPDCSIPYLCVFIRLFHPILCPVLGEVFTACLFHRGPLTLERLDTAVFLLYGFDRMPTDFFKTSMTSSFSPSCLRRLRFSASSSRMRFCSRFCLLTWPI